MVENAGKSRETIKHRYISTKDKLYLDEQATEIIYTTKKLLL